MQAHAVVEEKEREDKGRVDWMAVQRVNQDEDDDTDSASCVLHDSGHNSQVQKFPKKAYLSGPAVIQFAEKHAFQCISLDKLHIIDSLSLFLDPIRSLFIDFFLEFLKDGH